MVAATLCWARGFPHQMILTPLALGSITRVGTLSTATCCRRGLPAAITDPLLFCSNITPAYMYSYIPGDVMLDMVLKQLLLAV